MDLFSFLKKCINTLTFAKSIFSVICVLQYSLLLQEPQFSKGTSSDTQGFSSAPSPSTNKKKLIKIEVSLHTYVIAISFLHEVHLFCSSMLFEIFNKLTDGRKSSWFQINDNTNRVATSLKIKFLIKKFFSCKTYWRIITEWFVRNRLRFYIWIYFRTSRFFSGSKRISFNFLWFFNLYFSKFVCLFIYIVFPIWIYKYWFYTIILSFLDMKFTFSVCTKVSLGHLDVFHLYWQVLLHFSHFLVLFLCVSESQQCFQSKVGRWLLYKLKMWKF